MDEGVVAEVYDDKDGIVLNFDMQNGICISVAMSDKDAQDFIDIVQNKLNARIR